MIIAGDYNRILNAHINHLMVGLELIIIALALTHGTYGETNLAVLRLTPLVSVPLAVTIHMVQSLTGSSFLIIYKSHPALIAVNYAFNLVAAPLILVAPLQVLAGFIGGGNNINKKKN